MSRVLLAKFRCNRCGRIAIVSGEQMIPDGWDRIRLTDDEHICDRCREAVLGIMETAVIA